MFIFQHTSHTTCTTTVHCKNYETEKGRIGETCLIMTTTVWTDLAPVVRGLGEGAVGDAGEYGRWACWGRASEVAPPAHVFRRRVLDGDEGGPHTKQAFHRLAALDRVRKAGSWRRHGRRGAATSTGGPRVVHTAGEYCIGTKEEDWIGSGTVSLSFFLSAGQGKRRQTWDCGAVVSACVGPTRTAD